MGDKGYVRMLYALDMSQHMNIQIVYPNGSVSFLRDARILVHVAESLADKNILGIKYQGLRMEIDLSTVTSLIIEQTFDGVINIMVFIAQSVLP